MKFIKKTASLSILLLVCLSITSQTLSIDQTTEYINNSLKKNPIGPVAKRAYSKIKFYYHYYRQIRIDKKGLLLIDLYEKADFDSSYIFRGTSKIYFQHLDYSKHSDYIFISCKSEYSNCFRSDENNCYQLVYTGGFSIFESKDLYLNEKLANAFTYFFDLIYNNPDYFILDDDPFSPTSFINESKNPNIYSQLSQQSIPLSYNNGVFHLKIKVNGFSNVFILDSGASDVSISGDFEKKLIESGKITQEDYLQNGLYQIADGTIVECRRINLKNIQIGDFNVKNIIASVGSSDSPLLLGLSFLNEFSKWSIDNENNMLYLEK